METLQAVDSAILHAIREALGCAPLDAFFAVFTHVGQASIAWVVLGVCLLASRKYRAWGFALLLGLAFAGIAGEAVIKNLVCRPRPFVQDPSLALGLVSPSGYSFPSGHTAGAFCAATVVSCMAVRSRWKAAMWTAVLLVAFSRLYLCVHYPSDVLAGAALGVLCAAAAVQAGRSLSARLPSGNDAQYH